MKRVRLIFLFALFALAIAPMVAAGEPSIHPDNEISQAQYEYCIKCLYKKDTVEYVQPREPRKEAVKMDRAIDGVKYVYQKEWLLGVIASYSSLSTEDANYFVMLDDVDMSGSIIALKPFVAYSYSDNNCVGVRFGYNRIRGELESSVFDMGESNGITIDIPQFELDYKQLSYSLFHRSYAGLDSKGQFGLFADIECCYSYGTTVLEHDIANITPYSKYVTQSFDINFNPGVSVYIFPNVETTFSFGFGGLSYYTIKQYDQQGNYTGERRSSSMSFKFNLLAINLGVVVHLW